MPLDRMQGRQALRRTSALHYSSVSWSAAAAILAVTGGIIFDSIALVGFGLDSGLYTVAAAVALWRFHLKEEGRESGEEQRTTERRLIFIQGVLFFLLAVYVMNESGSKLFYRERSEAAAAGVAFSVLAVCIMAVLAAFKLLNAKVPDSGTLFSDARESAVRCYLPVMLFIGLWLPASRGWWWADPVAALLMVPFILREGWKALEDSKAGKNRTGPD